MDIREILLHLRQTASDRAVQRATGVHRQTVKRYRTWAAEQGLLTGALPPLPELEQRVRQTLPEPPPPQNVSSVEPYRALVSQLHKEGVEMTAIQQRLKERGYAGSYSAIRRFVGGLTTTQPEVFVRVECKPAEEAQVDFGFAGLLRDSETGELRRAWAVCDDARLEPPPVRRVRLRPEAGDLAAVPPPCLRVAGRRTGTGGGRPAKP